jgi:hypothetical protein
VVHKVFTVLLPYALHALSHRRVPLCSSNPFPLCGCRDFSILASCVGGILCDFVMQLYKVVTTTKTGAELCSVDGFVCTGLNKEAAIFVYQ